MDGGGVKLDYHAKHEGECEADQGNSDGKDRPGFEGLCLGHAQVAGNDPEAGVVHMGEHGGTRRNRDGDEREPSRGHQ